MMKDVIFGKQKVAKVDFEKKGSFFKIWSCLNLSRLCAKEKNLAVDGGFYRACESDPF